MRKSQSCRVVPALFALASLFGMASCRRGAEWYVSRGNSHFAGGHYDDAALDYQKAIRQNGQNGEAYYRLGLTNLKLGDQSEAYRNLDRAVQLLPKREDVAVQFANVCLAFYLNTPQRPQFLYDNLNKTAARLQSLNTQSFDAWRIKGIIAKSDNKPDEAIEDLRKAISLRPKDPGAVVPLVECLFAIHHDSEGEELAKALLQANKGQGLIYELLYTHYMDRNSPAQAEAVSKLRIDNNPQDTMSYFQLALHYHRVGRRGDMTATLQQILDKPKDFPQRYLRVGEFYATLPERDEALRYFRQGLELEPNDKLFLLKKIAAVQMAQADKPAAIQTLETAIKDSPNEAEARTMHAILLLDAGLPERLPDARAELQKLVGEYPRDPLLRYNLGRALLAQGDTSGARTRLQEAVGIKSDYIPAHLGLAELAARHASYSETLHEAETALAMEPTNFQARILHCVGLMGTGNNPQARAELLRLAREYPNSREVQFQLALLAMNEKDFKGAEKQLRDLYTHGQIDIRILTALTQVYVAQGQKEQAVKLLDQAVASSSQSQPLRALLASTASDVGMYDIALREYKWLTANSPATVEYFIGLGNVYRQQGHIPEAIEAFRQCATLAPNDPRIPSVVGFLEETNGQTELAKASYREALKTDPDNPIALNNLAYVIADRGGDLNQAFEMVQRAGAKRPNDNSVADTMAWIYVKEKKLDMASSIYSRLTARAPDNPVFHYHYGVALWQKGDRTKGRQELERALGKGLPKESEDRIRELLSNKTGAVLGPHSKRTAG
jgi:tetratricopeptide (TPR) repeat protein